MSAVSHLKSSLQSLSKSLETQNFSNLDATIAEAINLLNSIVESKPSDAADALTEIDRFISSKDSNQVAVDAISFELPKVVVKFVNVSEKCEEIIRNIIEHLIDTCNPRDLLSIFCEALDTYLNRPKAPVHYALLLDGISRVYLCIQRRHIELVKSSLPVILEVISVVSSNADERDENFLHELFRAAYGIGTSIIRICEKLEGRRKEELCAIVGLYALQNIALISRSKLSHMVSNCVPQILEFLQFLKFYRLSYRDLITGSFFDIISSEVSKGDGDEVVSCFTLVMDGASLAVIWSLMSDKVSDVDRQELNATLEEIRDDFDKRWQAVGMLKSTLSSIYYPWDINLHSIELLLKIIDGPNREEFFNCSIDFSSYMSSIFAVLKGIERMVMCAPDASSRKKVFGALKKVVSNIPLSERLDILIALISNSDSPSMMALFIDLVKEEINKGNLQKKFSRVDNTATESNDNIKSPFWSPHVLDVVELALKPPKGGPPPLPEHSEPVLSALNLYRFVLILESSGGTNQTAVLSENTLRKAFNEWLLPLKTLTMGIQSEYEDDSDELGVICALAPIQFVLSRCIELVEEKLKQYA